MYELQKQLMLNTPSTMAQAIDKRKVIKWNEKQMDKGILTKSGILTELLSIGILMS